MSLQTTLRRASALALIAAAATSLHAQTLVASTAKLDTSNVKVVAKADTTPETKPAADAAPLFGIKVSGYVETAFNAASGANGRAITGRLYERTNNQFSLNALKLTLDRPFDATKMDAGFHADVIFGQNAPVLQSSGFSLGPNGDVYQLYGTLNLPTSNGNGVQFRIGRMATFLGLELIETPLNPNVSIANQFIYVENFTQTGLSVEHRFNKYIDAQFRVLNGWDQVQDVNGRLSFMARLGVTPDDRSSIAFAAYTGPEQSDNNSALRSGFEVLASRRVGKVTTFAQVDVGQEQKNAALPDPDRNASWWAAGSWAVIDATPKMGVALRADYLSDRMSARTGSAFGIVGAPGHRLASATATLNLKAIPNVMIRPELRFDRSNQSVFNAKQQQVSLGLSAAYIF